MPPNCPLSKSGEDVCATIGSTKLEDNNKESEASSSSMNENGPSLSGHDVVVVKEVSVKRTVETQTPYKKHVFESKLICYDLVDVVLNASSAKQRFASASKTMWRLVGEVLSKHEAVYRRMGRNFENFYKGGDDAATEGGEDVRFSALKIMCDELFDQNAISWGRIVAVFAFCVNVAQHCLLKDQLDGVTHNRRLAWYVADYIGIYVGEKASEWLEKQGGWASLDERFPEENNMENTIWKGLLFTGLGLGVLATVVKTLR